MESITKTNLFKRDSPIVISMGDTFSKAEFEADLGKFIRDLLTNHEELAYLRQEPPELIPSVEKASIAGVKEGVYKCLADLLSTDPTALPDEFEYHFGTFFHDLNIISPVESRLLVNPIVQKHLTWQGQRDLEVNCGSIAEEVSDSYRAHLMEPRRPKSYE